MRQKTKNHQNQGPVDKKSILFHSLSQITQMGSLSAKTRAKNSHAWAPLKIIFFFTNSESVDVNSSLQRVLTDL
jgi:hypothetical protein